MMAGETHNGTRRGSGDARVVPEVSGNAGDAKAIETIVLHETIDLRAEQTGEAKPVGEVVPPELHFLSLPRQPDDIGCLADYRVLGVLGEGGMGLVLRAEDERLKREVAIKVMRPSVASNPDARRRFLREAQAAAAIEHDNVIGIYQVGEVNGVPFIAMPLLKGESLQNRLDRVGRLGELDAVKIGYQVAAALASAHARGLIHRDIKPDNIWLEAKTGRVKVLDFGLARLTSDDAGLTHMGSVLGTPLYMSPEQARGEELDARSDLYSLGAVLYRVLSGRPVVSGSSLPAMLIAIVNEAPPPLRSLSADIGADVAEIVERLLAKTRESRPAAAAETAKQFGEIIKRRRSGVAGAVVPATSTLRVPSSTTAMQTIGIQGEAPAKPRSAMAPPRRPNAPKWAILAGGAAFFAALLGIVTITIRNRDGGKTVIRVPEGVAVSIDAEPDSTVEIVQGEGAGGADEKGGRNETMTAATPAAVPPSKEPPSTPSLEEPTTERKAVEWIHSVGGGVSVRVSPEQTINVNPGKPLPDGNWHVQQVFLPGNAPDRIDDRSIQVLRSLLHLENLLLTGARLTDDGLTILDDMKELKRLELDFVPIGDATAARISRLEDLERLSLGETRITDAGFASICERLRGLVAVNLGPGMTDASVIAASQLPDLRSMGMKPEHATSRGFEALRSAAQLEHIRIVGATDDIVRAVATLPRLRNVVFDYGNASADAFRALARLERLETLNIDRSQNVTTAHLDAIAECPHLKGIWVHGTGLSAEEVAAFRRSHPQIEVHGEGVGR